MTPRGAPSGGDRAQRARTDQFGPVSRALAALLAAVWIGAGLLAVALGVRRGGVVPVIAGLAGVAYGCLFARAWWLGRPLRWPRR